MRACCGAHRPAKIRVHRRETLRADRCVQGDLRSMFVNGAIPTGPLSLVRRHSFIVRPRYHFGLGARAHRVLAAKIRLRLASCGTSPCLTFRLPGASTASHLTMLHVRRENAGRSSTVPFCERCATSTPDSSRARAATISSNKRHRCTIYSVCTCTSSM